MSSMTKSHSTEETRTQDIEEALFNEVHQKSVIDIIPWKHWHFANLHVRINGQEQIFEADWLKDLFYALEKNVDG